MSMRTGPDSSDTSLGSYHVNMAHKPPYVTGETRDEWKQIWRQNINQLERFKRKRHHQRCRWRVTNNSVSSNALPLLVTKRRMPASI